VIVKKTTASDARTICSYLLGPGRSRMPGRATVLGGTLLGRDVQGLVAELNAIASLRPEVKRPFVHLSFSAHPDDREISDLEALQMAEDWSWHSDTSVWILIRHDDHRPKRQHWHYLSCRVDELGVLTRNRYMDFHIQMQFARKWERFLDLIPVETPPRPDRPHGRARIDVKSGRRDEEARARGKPLIRDVIRSRLDAVEAHGLKGQALQQALMAAGLDMDLRLALGKPKGITWIDKNTGQRMKASDLGARYTAKTWLQRNPIFDTQGGVNGYNENVFPRIFHADSQLDDGDRFRLEPTARTKHARSGDTRRLGGNLGGPGIGPSIPGHESGEPRAGDATQPNPLASGVVRAGENNHSRTDGASGRPAPGFDRTRPDSVGSSARIRPHDVSGRPPASVPLGAGGGEGLDPIPRGHGTDRCIPCPSVGLGGLAVSPAPVPGGSAQASTDGPQHPELHGPADGRGAEVDTPRRRGR